MKSVEAETGSERPGSNHAGSDHPGAAKIVLVTGSLQGGGAERVLSNMANYWAECNWQVTVATWSGPDVEDFYALNPSVRRVWLGVKSENSSGSSRLRLHLLQIRRFRRFIKDLRPDAILSFIDRSNVQTILAATGLQTSVVVAERTHPGHYPGLPWHWKWLRKILYSRAQAVVAQTRNVALWLEQECVEKSYVIPNALRSLPTIVVKREPMILTVGRLDSAKGVDVLLRAFSLLHREFDDWSIMIVGDGPEKSALKGLCDELDLTSKVEFSQPVKDIESLMSRAGLVVQSSRYEGFPNVLIEAMGMGAAVISSNCPSGPSEIIQDGINGRLFPVDDVAALAEMMTDLLSRPDVRAQLGKKASIVRHKYRQRPIMELWESCIFPGRKYLRSCDSRKKGTSIGC